MRKTAGTGDLEGLRRLAASADPGEKLPATLVCLAIALRNAGDPEAAVTLLRRARIRYPGSFWIHYRLVRILAADLHRGREAMPYAMAALALRPASFGMWRMIGGIRFSDFEDYEGAARALRTALRINPDDVILHGPLAMALQRTGHLDGAIAELREAVRIDPGDATYHASLGLLLGRKRDFVGAVEASRKAAVLDPGNSTNRRALADAERLAAAQARLPAVLRGEDRPATAEEWQAVATVCNRLEDYAASARLWQQAFEAIPGLAADLGGSRYNVACSAALAGTSEWRTRAGAWPRADLALRAGQAGGGRFPGAQPAAKALRHWLEDTDLASIRDEAALAKLPESERDSFRALWRDVRALLKEASK